MGCMYAERRRKILNCLLYKRTDSPLFRKNAEGYTSIHSTDIVTLCFVVLIVFLTSPMSVCTKRLLPAWTGLGDIGSDLHVLASVPYGWYFLEGALRCL
eukprot:2264151-Pyramimonas_sp.AAC.1